MGDNMRTSKHSVESIINQKSFAVVGVSRNGKKFGNTIFDELKKKGRIVYQINRNSSEINGEKCYASINDLPEKPGAAIISINPKDTENAVREIAEAGIKNVWIQQGSKSDEAVMFCKENNINVVYDECILMFAEPVESIHKFHKFIWKIFGKLPN
jgi:predicted CoA-binding protein